MRHFSFSGKLYGSVEIIKYYARQGIIMEEDIIVMKHETLAVIYVFLLFHEVWLKIIRKYHFFQVPVCKIYYFYANSIHPTEIRVKENIPGRRMFIFCNIKIYYISADISRLPLSMVKP